MKTSRILLLPVFLGLILAGRAPIAAQEPSLFQDLGGFFISAQSNHPEIPGPKGFGAAASWVFAGSLMARLSYHRMSDDTRKEGIVCDQYSQRINCRPEMTETSVKLSGLRGALLWALPLGDRVRLGAGGGLSFNHVNAEAIGTVSERDADLLVPNAGIIGFTALFSAAITPIPAVPVRLTGGFGVHWVNFDTCSANEPPQYDPFCGMEAFKELELGLSYGF